MQKPSETPSSASPSRLPSPSSADSPSPKPSENLPAWKRPEATDFSTSVTSLAAAIRAGVLRRKQEREAKQSSAPESAPPPAGK